jgi:hypothetical protein
VQILQLCQRICGKIPQADSAVYGFAYPRIADDCETSGTHECITYGNLHRRRDTDLSALESTAKTFSSYIRLF